MCPARFSLTLRRHHCRCCGAVLCRFLKTCFNIRTSQVSFLFFCSPFAGHVHNQIFVLFCINRFSFSLCSFCCSDYAPLKYKNMACARVCFACFATLKKSEEVLDLVCTTKDMTFRWEYFKIHMRDTVNSRI